MLVGPAAETRHAIRLILDRLSDESVMPVGFAASGATPAMLRQEVGQAHAARPSPDTDLLLVVAQAERLSPDLLHELEMAAEAAAEHGGLKFLFAAPRDLSASLQRAELWSLAACVRTCLPVLPRPRPADPLPEQPSEYQAGAQTADRTSGRSYPFDLLVEPLGVARPAQPARSGPRILLGVGILGVLGLALTGVLVEHQSTRPLSPVVREPAITLPNVPAPAPPVPAPPAATQPAPPADPVTMPAPPTAAPEASSPLPPSPSPPAPLPASPPPVLHAPAPPMAAVPPQEPADTSPQVVTMPAPLTAAPEASSPLPPSPSPPAPLPASPPPVLHAPAPPMAAVPPQEPADTSPQVPAGSTLPPANPSPSRTDTSQIVPQMAPARHASLLLLAGTNDTLSSLYTQVYRGTTPPPFAQVMTLNPVVRSGVRLVFPAPPTGWPTAAPP